MCIIRSILRQSSSFLIALGDFLTEGKGKGGQSTYKETGLILRSVNKQANSHQQMGVRGSLDWVLKVTGKAISI